MANKKITDVIQTQELHTNDTIFIKQDGMLRQLPLIDVIVEQGTSGIWTYRKWSSGKAECWGTYTAEPQLLNTAWGNLYVAKVNAERINYPFSFVSRPKEITTMHTNANACWLYAESSGLGINTESASAIYAVGRPTAGALSTTLSLDFYIVGNWK